MRQPTMYSYMASHRYLYQIVFTRLTLGTRTYSEDEYESPEEDSILKKLDWVL